MSSISGTTAAVVGAGVAAAAAAVAYVLCTRKSDGTRRYKLTGLTAADIPAGGIKEVEVEGKKILLVHTSKGKIRATGAKCPHANLPLSKGVLAGDRLVCPYHAACFSVETGDIEDGPSLDRLPVFKVTVEPASGALYVDLPPEPAALPKGLEPRMCPAHSGDARHFVIIGGGPAGVAAAETLRQEGFGGRITVLNKEPGLPYDRVKMSKNMALGREETKLRSRDWFVRWGIALREGTEVTTVRAAAHEVVLSGGEVLKYDKLLCATGGPARTFRADRNEGFSIPGAELPGIHPMRVAEDAAAVEAALAAAPAGGLRVVIIGTSFIGMEAAAYLAANHKERVSSITAVGMEAVPFERVLGARIGGLIQQVHAAKGVQFVMNAVAAAFVAGPEGRVASVTLKNGTSLPADLVIIGSGIIPVTGYLKEAAAAGAVRIHDKAPGGILVDEQQCAGQDIYAAGDIAYVPLRYSPDPAAAAWRIEHWDVAMDQGRVAARNMLGQGVPYSSVPFFWTAQFGVQIRYAGFSYRTDDIIYHGDVSSKGPFVAYFVAAGAVAAVVSFSRDPFAVAAAELMRLRAMPTPEQLRDVPDFDLPGYLRTISNAATGGAAGKA